MTNDLFQSGLGNNAFQGIKGHEFHITQILGKSLERKELEDQLETLKKLLARTPESETSERLEISRKINLQEELLEKFKQDVITLAREFERIEINTERLRNAKEFFDRGEISEARAVLEVELEQMRDEQKHLLARRDEFETEILPKLLNNSEEFYVLAMATQVNFDNPNRFVEACDYFERSIQSYPRQNNLFQYAYFLQMHNQFLKAQQYYEKYLEQFAQILSREELAEIFDSLAILHSDQNEYERALEEFQKALEIRRQLAKTNPQFYLFGVAKTLNNLAKFHWISNEYEKALKECEEALEIYQKLAEPNSQSHLPYIATVLNNIANVHTDQNEYEKALKEFEEASKIYRMLAETNPQLYLPNLAATLNNLAKLHRNINEYEKALKEFEEALEIYQKLAKLNPQSYLPYVAMTSINLAIYHYRAIPDRAKSIEYALMGINIIFPIAETVPYTQKSLNSALVVLLKWGLSKEEVEQKVKHAIIFKDE